MTGMVEGRVGRVDRAVMSSAIELAGLVKKTFWDTQGHAGLIQYHVRQEVVVRMLALAASIEGLVLGGDVAREAPAGRVFIQDLVVGGIYVTHLHSGDVEWAYEARGGTGGAIWALVGRDKTCQSAADWGLCPYGLNGAWHPHAWTEATGSRATDGRDVGKMVDAEADGMDIDLEDG